MLAALSPAARLARKNDKAHRDALANNPLHRLFTSMLELVVAENMQAFGIGYRYDDPDLLAQDLEAHERSRKQSEELTARVHPQLVAQNLLPAPALQIATDSSGSTVGPDRRQSIPMWVRVQGRIYNHLHLHPQHLCHFISCAQDRLVSIDATRQSPQPTRYIELTGIEGVTYPNPTTRRFAEVELHFDLQNTFWVTVLATRTTAPTAHVSRYCY